MDNNTHVSVITVAFNNARGLERTLNSLANLTRLPLEIIVMDGGSSDDSAEVVASFEARLPIKFFSESDKGIYDAMNKGAPMVRGALVHYLNAGDEVYGDPYASTGIPYVLPVRIVNPEDGTTWADRIKLFGYGYCHQGVLFPSRHPSYNLRYRLAGDLDLIMRTFPQGLDGLPLHKAGGVIYYLGGISSINRAKGDQEILHAFRANRGIPYFLGTWIFLKAKQIFPRTLRRALAQRFLH